MTNTDGMHPVLRTLCDALPPGALWLGDRLRVAIYNGEIFAAGDPERGASTPAERAIPGDAEYMDIAVSSADPGGVYVWPSVETRKGGVVSTEEDRARVAEAGALFCYHGASDKANHVRGMSDENVVSGISDENVVKCFFYFVELGLAMFPKQTSEARNADDSSI